MGTIKRYIWLALALGCCCARADKLDDDIKIFFENALKDVDNESNQETQTAKKMLQESQYEDDREPFKWVQRFLVAYPLTCAMSKPGKVIEKTYKAFVTRYEGRMLEAFESVKGYEVLVRIRNLADPDERVGIMPRDTCPFRSVRCTLLRKSLYRTFDGSCNNLAHSLYGKAFTPLVRLLQPDYADGALAPRKSVSGWALPSAREVSAKTFTRLEVHPITSSYMAMVWGQFMDHDLDHTAVAKMLTDDMKTVDIKCGADGCGAGIDECFPINVPADDTLYRNKTCLTFVRSQTVPNRDCTLGPRQQVNQITSFIDASMVYGSNKELSDILRDLSNPSRGRMRTSAHPIDPKLKHLLPFTDNNACKGTDANVKCILAGDARANEANHLTTAHTIMVREHNRLEAKLHALNPGWDGEKLFQEARKIIGAVVQKVTYAEYLPEIFSEAQMIEHDLKLHKYAYFRGYDSSIDASVSNVFATAAFRFGHSMIPAHVKRPDHTYNLDGYKSMNLSTTLFRPSPLFDAANGGMDSFIRGLAAQRSTDVDTVVPTEISGRLFADLDPAALGADLVALNVQRGRDHGLPGYTKWREYCGLGCVQSFDDLRPLFRSNKTVNAMQQIYSHVEDIDLFVGGLAEKREDPQGLLGATFACIIGRQFRKLRYGDRYWHENKRLWGFSKDQLKEIRKMTLAKLFCTNGDNVARMSRRMMQIIGPSNPLVACEEIPDIDISKWKDVNAQL